MSIGILILKIANQPRKEIDLKSYSEKSKVVNETRLPFYPKRVKYKKLQVKKLVPKMPSFRRVACEAD